MPYFNLPLDLPNGASFNANIARAYQTAGATQPPEGVRLGEIFTTEPDVDVVAKQLALESYEIPDDKADQWLADACQKVQRAMVMTKLRQARTSFATHAIQAGMLRRTAACLHVIRPTFDATVKKLEAAAKKLPSDAPLDAQAVIAADATAAYKTALSCLETLAGLACVYGNSTEASGMGDTPGLAAVVEVPTVTPAAYPRMHHGANPSKPGANCLNPSKERDQVKAVLDHFDEHGADDTLVRIARGEWPALRLQLATSRADRSQRLHSLIAARQTDHVVAEVTTTPPSE